MQIERFVNIHVTKMFNLGIISQFVDKIVCQVWGPNKTTLKCYVFVFVYEQTVPVAARSKAWVCGRSLARVCRF